jgi:aspartate aminotransferase-like enzyme
MPEGIEWKAFNKTLKVDNGITIAGGQDEYAGKIFRISHLGYYDELDMITVIAAIERTLSVHKYSFDPGVGIAATQKAFLSHLVKPVR